MISDEIGIQMRQDQDNQNQKSTNENEVTMEVSNRVSRLPHSKKSTQDSIYELIDKEAIYCEISPNSANNFYMPMSNLLTKKSKYDEESSSIYEVLNFSRPKINTAEYEKIKMTEKRKILESVVNYQGVEMVLSDIIGDNLTMLSLLKQRDVKEILSKENIFKIGESIDSFSRLKYMDRKFVECKYSIGEDAYSVNTKTFEQIDEEMSNERTFLLADSTGTGKTTAFKSMAKKLKDGHQKFWVSYITLAKHEKVLEAYSQLEGDMTTDEIIDIIIEILDLESKFESELFTQLFLNNQTILLFDEIDEVNPAEREFILKFLRTIKLDSKNSLWIAIGHQYAKRFEEVLDVPAHKFVHYTWDQKDHIINEILNKKRIEDSNIPIKIHEDIKVNLDANAGNHNYFDICNNPLMIEIIADLYADDRFFNLHSLNFYDILEIYTAKQIRKNEVKVNRNSGNHQIFTVANIHQHFAIMMLLDGYYNKKFKDLALVRHWEHEKYSWTSIEIQQYGLLTTGPDDSNGKMSSLEFKRKIFAEFFLVQFLIPYLFCTETTSLDHMENESLYEVLETILSEIYDFEMTRYILFSYITDRANARLLVLQKEISDLLLKRVSNISKELNDFIFQTGSLKSLENWSIFLSIEPTLLKLLWLVGEKQNLIYRLFFGKGNRQCQFDLKELLELVSRFFGERWHLKFNKSRVPLITDEEIGNIEENESEKCKGFNRNLVKFLDLVGQNYEHVEKQAIYKDFIPHYKTIPFIKAEVFSMIISKGYDIFHDETGIYAEILIKFLKYSSDSGIVRCLGENIERYLKHESSTLRKVLFDTFHGDFHPLVIAMKSQDLRLFRNFRVLYTRYKVTWNEIQAILLDSDDIIPDIILSMKDEIFPEFQEFISEIFVNQENQLRAVVLRFFKQDKSAHISTNCKKYFEQFFNLIFVKDPSKIVKPLPRQNVALKFEDEMESPKFFAFLYGRSRSRSRSSSITRTSDKSTQT